MVGLDNQDQKFNNQINQYPKKNLIVSETCGRNHPVVVILVNVLNVCIPKCVFICNKNKKSSRGKKTSH